MPEITIDQYTTLSLNDYKGTYQLVEGWINRDGEFKPNWCDKEFGKKGEKVKKPVPLSVKIGNKDKIKELAEWLLVSVADSQDEDIPF